MQIKQYAAVPVYKGIIVLRQDVARNSCWDKKMIRILIITIDLSSVLPDQQIDYLTGTETACFYRKNS